ncbi:MAG: hypothetical protein HGB18_02620 [Candidatus Moranbacteria bacterium]|nr:hypothetical protein [Candidatus Moranbacteria bacterium]
MTLPFSNRHKNGLRSFFAVSFFLLSALFVLHVGIDGSVFHPGDGSFFVTAQAADGDAEVSVADKIGAWFADAVIGNAVKPFLWLINFALWIVLKFETLILIFATTIFGWAVDPTSVRNTLNMASVYTLWRMVRDFFNLFFILTILFIAFATIFQVHAYNYKKLLWHLVLMALLVNFSFPVTRFIIDATNVPMYFFMESMFRDNSSPNPTQLFGTVFSTSGLQQIMVPDFQDFYATFSDPSTMTTRLIISIIFMFLFSMSLLVMAVLFVIRLIMLTVLIIFAPLGFAGTAIPGFEGYAKQWWNHLFKYAIFGPSAMLMMLVAVTFLQNFKNDQLGSGTFSNYSSNLTSTNDDKTLIASMAQTIVPIVLIWMAISTGQTAGIQGAAGITSWAQKTSKMAGKNAAKWGGKGALFVGTVGQGGRIGAYAKGAGAALKNVPKSGQLFGKNIGGEKGAKAIKWAGNASERQKDSELRAKNVFEKGWSKGRTNAGDEIHKRNVSDKEKEFEDKKHDEAKLRSIVTSGTATASEREAAAKQLLKKDAIRNQDDLDKVLMSVGGSPAQKQESRAEIIRRVDKKVIQDADKLVESIGHLGDDFKSISAMIEKVDGDALKMDANQYGSLLTAGALAGNASLRSQAKAKLDSRLKKEGRIKAMVDYEIANNANGRSTAQIHEEYFGKMTPAEIGKMKDFHGDRATAMDADFKTFIEDKYTSGEWTLQDMQEAYKNLNSEQKHSWSSAGLRP